MLARAIRLVFNNLKFAFNDTTGSRALARLASAGPPSQLAIEPPQTQADDSRENGNDTAEHHERDKSQDYRYTDRQRADDNDKHIRNGVSCRKAPIWRRVFQFAFLV